MTISLYDEADVPIGTFSGPITVAPEDGVTTKIATQIPGWAFAGTCYVSANRYTACPSAGGVPICPEGVGYLTLLRSADP